MSTMTTTKPALTYSAVLESELQRLQKRFDEEQAKFIDNLKRNPAQAIEWCAQDMIAAQTRLQIAMALIHNLRQNATDAASALELVKAQRAYKLQEAVAHYLPPASTCAYSNAIEQTQLQTKMDELGKSSGIYQRLIERLADAV